MIPSQISEAHPSPNWQDGNERYHAKGWFRPAAFQGVLTLSRVPEPSATKNRTKPLCSSLPPSISNAGRTHFTQRSPPEQHLLMLGGSRCIYNDTAILVILKDD